MTGRVVRVEDIEALADEVQRCSPGRDAIADRLRTLIANAVPDDEHKALEAEAAAVALEEAADWLTSFLGGYTSETPQTRAGRDIVAQVRSRAATYRTTEPTEENPT